MQARITALEGQTAAPTARRALRVANWAGRTPRRTAAQVRGALAR